ncbi:hypothetical protein JCM11641_007475 [Rhodosporidiobolus odoratus]
MVGVHRSKLRQSFSQEDLDKEEAHETEAAGKAAHEGEVDTVDEENLDDIKDNDILPCPGRDGGLMFLSSGVPLVISGKQCKQIRPQEIEEERLKQAGGGRKRQLRR